MENIAEKEQVCKPKDERLEEIPEAKDFFDCLEVKVKEMLHLIISKAIGEEFRKFIGAAPYERNKERKDHRNGFRYRNFESRFGVIEDIPIPRANKKSFFPSIFKRWKRRERKIVKIISDIFLRGVSTRKIKVVSKVHWEREYSAATVSEFNKTLKEELLNWMNRKIEAPIKYLFLDGVNLKVRRH